MFGSRKVTLAIVCLSVIALPLSVAGRQPPYTEDERQAEYIRRGNEWPPKVTPDTPGWKRILDQRFAQVRALTNYQMKWDGFVQTLTACMMKNYTEYGWGLTQAPEELTNDMRQAIFDGLPTARSEGEIDAIDGPSPLFIDRPDLTRRVSGEIRNMIVSWRALASSPLI